MVSNVLELQEVVFEVHVNGDGGEWWEGDRLTPLNHSPRVTLNSQKQPKQKNVLEM